MVHETTFDKFFSNRESLIYQFKKGDLTKKEFIEEQYAFITRLDLKPFVRRIDSFEKGIYNYQYYNIMAKYSSMKSKDPKIIEKHPEMIQMYKEKTNYFYRKKDETIIKLLRYLDYKNVEAYPIKVESNALKDRIFEIVLKDFNNTVLHSISKSVLEELKKENVYTDIRKNSIIEKYVNERY
ncbi:MAG: hypothetical protein GX285_05290 [Clostridiales bacterium]|nr:hypothetical protein [Clostridiales bacterium]